MGKNQKYFAIRLLTMKSAKAMTMTDAIRLHLKFKRNI